MNSPPKQSWTSRLAMGLLILAITVGFYWKLVLTSQYNWFGVGGDIALQVLPWFQYQARELHSGRVPLWDPNHWIGQPLLAQAQPGAAYPLNWLLFMLPLKNGLIQVDALNWYFISIHFMAILFCYMLCRDLQRSRSASLVAGCVFGLAGYVGNTDWPQMVNGAVWAPLVLMFLLRAVRGQAPLLNAALSGGFLGLAWLSGHHQIPIFVTLLIASLWLFFAVRQGRLDWKIVSLAAISLVAMFFISALQTLPAYEYGHLARRWVGVPDPIEWNQKIPYSVHTQYSMSGASLAAILIPGMNGRAAPFVGVVAFTLALVGFAIAWKERPVRLFTTIGLAGLLFSLGFHNIFHGIAYSLIPLVEKARSPWTAIYIFHLGLMVLAAFGLDSYFAAQITSPWKSRIALGCAVFGALIGTLVLNAALNAKLNFEFDDRIALTALFSILLAGLLYAFVKGRISRPHAVTALLILLLIELGNNSYIFAENKGGHRYPEKYETSADIAKFLKDQPGPFRVEIDENELPQNFGDWYGIEVNLGYVVSTLSNILALDWSSERAKQLLNVAYYIGKKPANANQQTVFEGSSGLNVYRNPEVLPRVWIVHETALVRNASEVNYYVRAPDFDLRRRAPIEAPVPRLATCDPTAETIQFSSRNPQSYALQAQLACDGMLIVGESYTPGWKATIDGKPAEIRQVYGALRGVVVPQGTHSIRMKYRPRSVIFGAALTLTGVLGICILGLLERRRSRV
jgi:membrane protein YfhO